jgi:hypothetical protein
MKEQTPKTDPKAVPETSKKPVRPSTNGQLDAPHAKSAEEPQDKQENWLRYL